MIHINIETLKENEDGWFANGDVSIPNVEGAWGYEDVQAWLETNTPDPEFTPEEIATNEAEAINAIIDAELIALDIASIRSLREYVAAQADAPQFIKDKESAAILKRSERV